MWQNTKSTYLHFRRNYDIYTTRFWGAGVGETWEQWVHVLGTFEHLRQSPSFRLVMPGKVRALNKLYWPVLIAVFISFLFFCRCYFPPRRGCPKIICIWHQRNFITKMWRHFLSWKFESEHFSYMSTFSKFFNLVFDSYEHLDIWSVSLQIMTVFTLYIILFSPKTCNLTSGVIIGQTIFAKFSPLLS